MIEQLKELVGKKFSYKEKEILIKNIKKVSGIYVVLTDSKTYNFFESEVSFFLNEIFEIPRVKVKQEALEKRKMELQKKQIQTSTAIATTENLNLDIKTVLFDTLEKVRSDKGFIPQANAICNVVTQMINIQKLEMQLKKK